jgi:predicted NAD-dependent protein-ADP-ribosyltransferase YbiA (DUF1768 family)
MNHSQLIRAKNTGMFPSGFIHPTTMKTTTPVKYVSPTGCTGAGHYMSTFYPKSLTYKGITYPTVEHAYQAAKFRFTDHPIISRQFRQGGYVTCPKQAKNLGTLKNLSEIGVTLDYKQWIQYKHDIFKQIIQKRMQTDMLFNDLVSSSLYEGKTTPEKIFKRNDV